MRTYSYDNILGDFVSHSVKPTTHTRATYNGPIIYEPVSDVQTCTSKHPNYFISEYSDKATRYNPYYSTTRETKQIAEHNKFQGTRNHRRIQQTTGVRNLGTLLDRISARNTSMSTAWQQKNANQLQHQDDKSQEQKESIN